MTPDVLMGCFKRYGSLLDAEIVEKALQGNLETEEHCDLIEIQGRVSHGIIG